MVTMHSVNGELHTGPKEDCAKCAKRTTSLSTVSKKNGSVGGKKSVAKNKRKCACGSILSNSNKSGLCRKCTQALSREVKKKKPKMQVERKLCITCGKDLNRKNRSGYCLKHYYESPQWRARLVEHGSWISAACLGKDVKDRPDLKVGR